MGREIKTATIEELNFTIGCYIGSQIEKIGIPQLSIDCKWGSNETNDYIIMVSDEDDEKYTSLLINDWEWSHKHNTSPEWWKEWEKYIEFRRYLLKKYLNEVEMYSIPAPYYSDVEAVRKGLNSYLANTDICSHFAVGDFLSQDSNFLNIYLTLEDI